MTQATTKLRFVNLRHELRLALLAGAESCWIYALVLLIGTNAGLPRQVSPVGIFIVYWIALLAGRALPRSKQAWRVLQLATLLIAVIALLAAIRIGLYSDVPLTDVTWLPNYVARTLSFFERATAEEISTLALIFTFLRGLNFAQRPLTLWVVGFEFRLGIVIFFLTAFVSALSVPVNFIEWIFVYFGLSLLAIALARIEDEGQEYALGAKWAGVLISVIAATMLLGFTATQFLTLETINALLDKLAPLGFVVQVIVTLIAIPTFYLLDLIGTVLAPFFDWLRDMFANFKGIPIGENPAVQQLLQAAVQQAMRFAPYARYLGVIFVVLFIGWLIMRALNKRMRWEEKEMFAREALGERDSFATESQRRPRPPKLARYEIHAENVRRIYAALLAQAEALGLKRRDAETPLEFLPRLTARFPEETLALEQITHAYVAVHYAQQPATNAQVRELRAVWQQTRQRMREKSATSRQKAEDSTQP